MTMNQIEKRTYDVDGYNIELRTDGRPMIKGHAAVFNQVSDRGGWFLEKIAPGAFAESLKSDDVRATFNHDPNIVLGRNKAGTLRLLEDARGLFAEIDPPETQQAKDLLISMSPPARGRGLKLDYYVYDVRLHRRPLRGGVD